MNKRFLALLLALMLLAAALPMGALAAQKKRAYIIPDSDTRLLTYEELWQWDYESIGYIFNEIFARHGYNFIPGNQYDNYFRTRPWYTPNADPDNSAACYSQLSDVEWQNERLCKDVRAEMKRVTWPTRTDVLRWSGVVVGALLFFGIYTAVLDNVIITPGLIALTSLGA